MHQHLRTLVLALSCALGTTGAAAASAQTPPSAATAPARGAPSSPVQTLDVVQVTAPRLNPLLHPGGIAPLVQRLALPQTTVSIDRQQIHDTTNVVDPEDALRYFPSLFLRTRNFGDTQSVLATRMWGVDSSARSLVYVDGVPLSALISNNNTTGAPRWGMVPPSGVEGIDVLYGPYAAAFPGNSMGAVVLITTRLPDVFTGSVSETGAWQDFDMHGRHHGYGTSSTQAAIGDRAGRFRWFLSANHANSFSQPLYFVTSPAAPAGTSGAIAAVNKLGQPADVVGASGLQHSLRDTFTGTFAYDLTDWLRATYRVGYWHNDTDSSVASYLTDAAGRPTFGGVGGFVNGRSRQTGRQLMNALSLTTNSDGNWNWQAVFTRYRYLSDGTRSPAGVLAAEAFTPNGYIASLGGTGWGTQDFNATWQPGGADGIQRISFGAHHDAYRLDNPTYDAADWMASPADGDGTLHTDGRGRTSTYALWAQDVWRFTPTLRLTLGGRWEAWRASDGFNFAGGTAVAQPREHARGFSPKAAFAWQMNPEWSAELLLGVAYRFPTVSELYQIVSTGATFAVPNPHLLPEHVRSGDLVIARQTANTRLQLSLFQQNVNHALLAQTTLLNGVYTNTVQNVGLVRDQGAELVARWDNAFVPRLTLVNSLTYVHAMIASDPTFESAAGTRATGKRVPYVPRWRDTLRATYRINPRWVVTLAGRYQSDIYSTLDNTDTVNGVFGSFDPFFTLDAHVHVHVSDAFDVDFGVDNLTDRKYFEYHPFPMRTVFLSGNVHFGAAP